MRQGERDLFELWVYDSDTPQDVAKAIIESVIRRLEFVVSNYDDEPEIYNRALQKLDQFKAYRAKMTG